MGDQIGPIILESSVDQHRWLGGWLNGDRTYIWIGDRDACYGSLAGWRLLELAKRIVTEFEPKKPSNG